jgi:DNA-binding transcriptional LysR family regulator
MVAQEVKMELRQIQYFCKVASLKSFTQAAEQLHITQPTITHAIHKLEEELDIQLFDRNKKRALLTLEGEVFLEKMHKIIDNIDEAVSELKDLKALRKGTIKLGVPPMLGAYMFPWVFLNFNKSYPELQLIVSEEESTPIAVQKIETGDLDLAIIILPENSETIDSLVITPEEYVLCVHPDHPLNLKGKINFGQLRNEQFILLKEGSLQRKIVISRCLSNNFTPNIVFSTSQVQTIKGLVANGAGISLLMRMVINNDPNIAIVPMEEPINFHVGLAWNKGKHLSKAALAMVDFMKNIDMPR